MIIGLCALPNAGKDTAADVIKSEFDFNVVGFSDSLKRVVSHLFDYDYEMLHALTEEDRKIRSTVDPRYNKTPVSILEDVGLKMRQVHPLIFVNKTLMDNVGKDIIIKDVRYPNEIRAIKEAGGQVWKIKRGPDPSWLTSLRNNNILSVDHGILVQHLGEEIHEAQWRLQCSDVDKEFDFTISNDYSLEVFQETVKGKMRELLRSN